MVRQFIQWFAKVTGIARIVINTHEANLRRKHGFTSVETFETYLDSYYALRNVVNDEKELASLKVIANTQAPSVIADIFTKLPVNLLLEVSAFENKNLFQFIVELGIEFEYLQKVIDELKETTPIINSDALSHFFISRNVNPAIVVMLLAYFKNSGDIHDTTIVPVPAPTRTDIPAEPDPVTGPRAKKKRVYKRKPKEDKTDK